MKEEPTLSLPFDQYQRYRLVADILGAVRGSDEPLCVLDVGGRTALLRRFLPDDLVHLVDVEVSDAGGLVLGDGSRLPFADAAVDAVVTFDTLEHVPPDRRADFVAECARVAARWVVIAGPYATERVAEAELLLTNFLSEKLGIRHRYLAEHAVHGLPDLDATEAGLRDGGAEVLRLGHANLDRWLALMCLELYLDRDPPLRAIAKRYFRFYNESLYASDHAPPVYRHAVVAALHGAPLPDPSRLLAAPVAPTGAFAPTGHLLRELLSFDVERDAVRPEWDRLGEVNQSLHADLTGHEQALAILRADLAGHQGVIAELRRTAAEQLEVIETLRGERIRERTAQEEVQATQRSQIHELERVVKELGVRLQEEGRAWNEGREALERDLEGHRDLVRDLRAELEAREENLLGQLSDAEQALIDADQREQELRSDLDGERAEVARQRAELESRWASLKRALGSRPKG